MVPNIFLHHFTITGLKLLKKLDENDYSPPFFQKISENCEKKKLKHNQTTFKVTCLELLVKFMKFSTQGLYFNTPYSIPII